MFHFRGEAEIGRPRDGETGGEERSRGLPSRHVVGSERGHESGQVDGGAILGEIPAHHHERRHQVSVHAQPRRRFRFRESGTKRVPPVVLLHRGLQFTSPKREHIRR